MKVPFLYDQQVEEEWFWSILNKAAIRWLSKIWCRSRRRILFNFVAYRSWKESRLWQLIDLLLCGRSWGFINYNIHSLHDFTCSFVENFVSLTKKWVPKKNPFITSSVKLSHIFSIFQDKAGATKYSEIFYIWLSSFP